MSGLFKKSTALYIALIALAVVYFFVNLFVVYTRDPQFFAQGDFPVFYATAEASLRGENIYDGKSLEDDIFILRGAEGAVRYLYPPVALLLFYPLLLFPFPVAKGIWLIANLALIIGIGYVSIAILLKKQAIQAWTVYALLVASFGPLITNIDSGQVNALLLFLILLNIYLLQHKKYWLASISLAVAISIKLFPVAIVGLYIVQKKWQMVWRTCVVLSVIALISVAGFGVDAHKQYLQRAEKLSTDGIHAKTLDRPSNATFNGALHQTVISKGLISENAANVVRYVVVSVTLVLLFIGTFLMGRVGPQELLDDALLPFVWLSALFFSAADIHTQYLLLLLPAIFWIVYTLLYNPDYLSFVYRSVAVVLMAFIVVGFEIFIGGGLIQGSYERVRLPIAFIANTIFLFGVCGWYVYNRITSTTHVL